MTLTAQQGGPLPTIRLTPGLVITHSVRVKPGVYRLPGSAALDSAVITIRGSHIVVDFAGATMEGSDPAAEPDQDAGLAVSIDGGTDVRLMHAHITGYKVAILARGTHGLTLTDNDVSDNWKPRLFSLPSHESLVDWLSYHHNEHDEWLRYGAGIYLVDVVGGTIRGNRAEHGMNGLMLTRTDSVRVTGNDFSFNSGLGTGLYRSSDNTIVGNRLEFNVRGYSHGHYRRGQDSANLLIYEQSDGNVVAFNTATHGGDGLFLWAGQHTMDTGEGGANDNLFYRNDFSFAPTNAMEATFSRNAFIGNRADGSDHGLWGGYSYSSPVIANCFDGNLIGIAIEHGQDDTIAANRFQGGTTGISLWADSIAPSDWGYPKVRDTRSRDYVIRDNSFSGARVGLRIRNTSGASVAGNTFVGVDSMSVLRDTARYAAEGNAVRYTSEASDTACALPVPSAFAAHVPDLTGLPGARPASPLAARDRSAIVVDQWGPYDWRSPKLWPVDSTHAVPLRLAVLGPAGRWTLVEKRGLASVTPASGMVGDTITVTPKSDSTGDWRVTLVYRGAAVTSPRDLQTPAGKPYRFGYEHFEPPIDWTARMFTWADSTSPFAQPAAFARVLEGTPIHTEHVSRLDEEGYGRWAKGLPGDHFAVLATGDVTLAPGTYTIRTISDKAIRVWVDDSLVIDDWTPHESRVDHAVLAGGRHRLRVEYVQVDGWTEFRLDIVRGRETSTGSPSGP